EAILQRAMLWPVQSAHTVSPGPDVATDLPAPPNDATVRRILLHHDCPPSYSIRNSQRRGSMTENSTIAAMPLYTNLDRVDRGLSALGIGPKDPIPPERLFALDQWHYHGTEAVRAAAERLGLGPSSRVLDIGSGVGGPARYLA